MWMWTNSIFARELRPNADSGWLGWSVALLEHQFIYKHCVPSMHCTVYVQAHYCSHVDRIKLFKGQLLKGLHAKLLNKRSVHKNTLHYTTSHHKISCHSHTHRNVETVIEISPFMLEKCPKKWAHWAQWVRYICINIWINKEATNIYLASEHVG